MAKYKVVNNEDGTYNLKHVPIFSTHTNRGFKCDYAWMQDAMTNHRHYKQQDYLPPIVIGHNVKGREKEAVGFIDNLALTGKKLYADLVKVPKWLKEKILTNAYPSRSVEILPKSKRILALALLGGTTPHFALPQMSYANDEQSLWLRSKRMFDKEEQIELFGMIQDAIKGAVEEPEPVIYDVGTSETIKMFQSETMPEVFEDEETGEFYALGEEDNEFYRFPKSVMKALMAKGAAAKAAVAKGGYKVAQTRPGMAVMKGAAKASQVGRKVKGAIKTHPKLSIAGTSAGIFGAAEATRRIRDKRKKNQGYSLEGYTIDDDGIMYNADGQVIGKAVAATETRNTIPQLPDGHPPKLKTGTTSGKNKAATKNPGSAANAILLPVDREDSPQFNELTEEDIDEMSDTELLYVLEQAGYDISEYLDDGEEQIMNTQGMTTDQIENYSQLRRQVDDLTRHHEIATFANNADEIEKYLLAQKKKGAPVGDLKTAIDYLLTQDEEQIAQYKKLLEGQPKLSLGKSYALEVTPDPKAIDTEYEEHRADYEAIGVTKKDLKIEKYVRSK